MNTEMQIPENIKQQILELLFNHFANEHLTVFVFGSFAEGTAKQSSDIDIGIVYNYNLSLNDILKVKTELNEQVKTLRSIDLVNFSEELDPKFREIALKKVILWHQGKESKTNLNSIKEL